MKRRNIVIFLIIIVLLISIIISKPQELNLSDISIESKTVIAMLIAILSQVLANYLRAKKHQLLINKIRPISTRLILRGQMLGLFFNMLLPFRLGELLRARFIANSVSISQSAVFSTIVFERVLDLVAASTAYLIIIIVAGFAYVSNALLPVIILSIGVIFTLLLYCARLQQRWFLKTVYVISSVFNDRLKNRIRMMGWSSIFTLKNVLSRDVIGKYIGISLVMWLAYGLSIYCFILIGLANIDFFDNIRMVASSYLGISIPLGPAYLGVFQSVFTNQSLISVSYLHDNNVTFLIWAILVSNPIVFGVYYLFSSPQQVNKSKDFSQALKNKLHRDTDISSQFAQFMDAYFKGDEINKILTSEEQAQNFQVIKTFTGGSKALTILAWQKSKIVVKKITLKQFQDKLQAQYEWLVERSQYDEIAKTLGETSDSKDYYSIDIEYRDDYVSYFDLIHSSTYSVNKKILINVCKFMSDKIYVNSIKLSKPEADKRVQEYIDNKICGKIQDSANTNVSIGKLIGSKKLIVNSKSFHNYNTVIDKITHSPKIMKDLSDIYDSPIHGDLTIDNIIVDPSTKKYILLDPNNENAISDEVVDYAKLMQSLHSGYEFLRTLNSVEVQGDSVKFKEVRSLQYDRLYDDLKKHLKTVLPQSRYRTLLFHEAVHYCRMLTYRCDINSETAPAFYAVAIRLFNEFIEQYE